MRFGDILGLIEDKDQDALAHMLRFDASLEAGDRLQTGTFYTPLEVAKTMCLEALMSRLVRAGFDDTLVEAFCRLKASPGAALDPIKEAICHLTWCDLACGTGVFLVAYTEWLEEACQVYGWQTDLVTQAIQNWTVNDINAKALELLRAFISQRYGPKVYPKTLHCDALLNLKSNPLISDQLKRGGFDVVIGNPPYLGERGNKDYFRTLRQDDHLNQRYEGKMDLFYFFLYQALDFVALEGVITQVTTSYFVTADGAQKLRDILRKEVDFYHMTLYDHQKLFKDVKQMSFMVYTFAKKNNKDIKVTLRVNHDQKRLPQKALYDDRGLIRLYHSNHKEDITQDMVAFCPNRLGQVVQVNQGLVSGADRVNKRHLALGYQASDLNKPIYVFEAHEIPETNDKSLLKPFIKNGDIHAFHIKKHKRWVLYAKEANIHGDVKWLAHLEPYKRILEKRREVVLKRRDWTDLQWPRDPKCFEKPKIVVPQRSFTNAFAYTDQVLYGSADVYFITHTGDDTQYLKALAAYLNASLVYYWLFHHGKRKGPMLELYATPLEQIPVPTLTPDQVNRLADLYDQACLDASHQTLDLIDDAISLIYGFPETITSHVQAFKKSQIEGNV